MGTRSTTVVYEDNEKKIPLCRIYSQWDGYYSGHGEKLKQILSNKKIINGISGQTIKEAFNGMGCLAAWLIHELKQKIGNIYIYPIDPVHEEYYHYEIYPGEESFGENCQSWNKIHIKANDDYDGPIDDFITDDEYYQD